MTHPLVCGYATYRNLLGSHIMRMNLMLKSIKRGNPYSADGAPVSVCSPLSPPCSHHYPSCQIHPDASSGVY